MLLLYCLHAFPPPPPILRKLRNRWKHSRDYSRKNHSLTKQVVHRNLLLHYPAMLATGYAVGGYHCKMYGMLCREGSLQALDAVAQLLLLVLVNSVCRTGKLHLTEIYYIVGTRYEQVYLTTVALVITSDSP